MIVLQYTTRYYNRVVCELYGTRCNNRVHMNDYYIEHGVTTVLLLFTQHGHKTVFYIEL
jgi:hypothetical protein